MSRPTPGSSLDVVVFVGAIPTRSLSSFRASSSSRSSILEEGADRRVERASDDGSLTFGLFPDLAIDLGEVWFERE